MQITLPATHPAIRSARLQKLRRAAIMKQKTAKPKTDKKKAVKTATKTK